MNLKHMASNCLSGYGSVAETGGNMLIAGLVLASHAAFAVNVTVETTDCNGGTGVASFESSRLAKIQDAVCADPTDPEVKLQQVLLHSQRGSSYEVLTVTRSGRQNIMDQINNISGAELRNLERPDVLIEQREVLNQTAPRASSSATRGNPSVSESEGVPPEIEISDPPISRVRSQTSIITSPGLNERSVVGRVRSSRQIVSLTVNGNAEQLSDQGVFVASVPLREERTPVSVIAVDENGSSSSVDFVLVRSAPAPEVGSQATAPNEFGAYHALVIANADYANLDDLVTPLNDGQVIAGVLAQVYGFEVTKLFNASRYEMMSALNNLRRELTENDNLLIYFAGHGAFDEANKRGHWLPVDAEHNSTANWVSTIDITDIVNAMSARHILVVADSCYSGALTRSEHITLDPGMSDDLRQRWLRTVAKTRSRHLLTSGGIKPVVDDGGNGHSVFANALIEVLSHASGIVESSAVYERVNALVAERARALHLEQTPRYAQLKRTGHEYGEFLLVARP